MGILGAILVSFAPMVPPIVYAGSAVGGGGSGGGGGGGHQSSYGYGWYKYGVNGNGPKDGFRDGTKWSSVEKACKKAGADMVIAFIVLDKSNDAMVYKWEGWTNVKSGGNYISIKTAKGYYDDVDKDAKDGFTWGKNVAWFCHNSTGPYKITPTTTVSSATQSGQAITAGVGEKVTFRLKIDASGKGNPPTVKWGYGDNDSGGTGIFSDDKDRWSDNMGSGSERTKDVDLPSGAVAGKTYCLSTYVNPHANTDQSMYPNTGDKPPANNIACVTINGGVTPTAACQPLSLASMTLGQSGSYTAAIQLSNLSTLPTFSYRIYKEGAPGAYITVTPPALQVTGMSPNQKLSATVTYTPATLGTYILDWRVTGGINEDCSQQVTVAYQPYFQVQGDILGGFGGFDAATSIIASWNSNNSADNYRGAGTTLAAIAGTQINSFVTSSANNSPSRLAFANTPASVSPPKYGGGFTALPSEPDYYSNASGTTQNCSSSTLSVASLVSGLYSCTGNITLNGGQLVAGTNVTIRTTGNIFIAGNITYAPYSLTNIPRLNVITKGGNIIVSSTVTEMHGVFVAQKGTANTGLFYSCGGSLSIPYGYTTNDAQCITNTLTVYGSVIADKLILGRTQGSWHDLSSQPAETFIHSPETWLSKPASSGTTTKTKFDSYISLPPVL